MVSKSLNRRKFFHAIQSLMGLAFLDSAFFMQNGWHDFSCVLPAFCRLEWDTFSFMRDQIRDDMIQFIILLLGWDLLLIYIT